MLRPMFDYWKFTVFLTLILSFNCSFIFRPPKHVYGTVVTPGLGDTISGGVLLTLVRTKLIFTPIPPGQMSKINSQLWSRMSLLSPWNYSCKRGYVFTLSDRVFMKSSLYKGVPSSRAHGRFWSGQRSRKPSVPGDNNCPARSLPWKRRKW